jgi:hypothetical protein
VIHIFRHAPLQVLTVPTKRAIEEVDAAIPLVQFLNLLRHAT